MFGKAFFLIIFLFFSSAGRVSAQIINELYTPTTNDDWVELFNNDTVSVDLSGFRLQDKAGNTKTFSGVLEPGDFFVVGWSNRLNKDGDVVELIKISDESQVDEISYGTEGGVCAPSTGQSIGRVDNGNTIERFEAPTKEASNVSASLDPCPTPTPEPTPTPTPEPTSTPTQSPDTSASPTVLAKSTEKSSNTPKSATKNLSRRLGGSGSERGPLEEFGVMGASEEFGIEDDEEEIDAEQGGFPWLAAVFILVGVSFIGYAGYPFLKSLLKKYNLRDQKNDKPEKISF